MKGQLLLVVCLLVVLPFVSAFRTPDNLPNKMDLSKVGKAGQVTPINQELLADAIKEKPNPLRWLVDRAHEQEYWHK